MFTTKFTKANGKAPPLVKKFAEGGIVGATVPMPAEDPRGNDYRKGQRRIARESEGSSGRTFGEHAKAIARAIWEPKEFREIYEGAGQRDRSNTLYDRKKSDEEE